ncbi:hypothetical protein [Leptothoe spongobia]|uniref:Uncharacterized protein n=1 Tax=Leptothoe spongobia TAU-MAC 1115 TaxID=1967444 RepID=A0A947DDX9_9CYAN|nr:hypothetical protein [Leptothoe spongobia]MBT9314151.1 hypothetical protein [Leptothoe spongobia TAU-MAC 1115]
MSITTQQSLTTMFKTVIKEYSPTDILIALDAAVKNRSEYTKVANSICDVLMDLDSPKAQKWRDRILLRDNTF